MLRLSRSTIALFLLASLLTALHEWLRAAEQAGYAPPPILSRLLLHGPLRRRAAVLAELEAARQRRETAEGLATALVEGHLTLREAAARLRDSYRSAPDFFWTGVERRFPGASDAERCCRLMIGEVRTLEGPIRPRAQDVAARLEAELDVDLRSGTLSL